MSDKVISEATPVRIGLVILFLGAFGSAIWWGSSVNSKLDYIIKSQSDVSASVIEVKTAATVTSKDLSELTLRVAIIESKLAQEKKP